MCEAFKCHFISFGNMIGKQFAAIPVVDFIPTAKAPTDVSYHYGNTLFLSPVSTSAVYNK